MSSRTFKSKKSVSFHRAPGGNGRKEEMMKRSLFAALVVLLCLAFAAGEQTTYSLELSAAGYLTSTPHSAGDATFVVALGTAAVSSYTTIEIRPINSTTPTTVTRSGA